MSKEIYGSKATITFTMQQALAFITEKLQDDFSSDFKFTVVIQEAGISENSVINPLIIQKSYDYPEAVSDNPWLIPDKDGWFTKDPEHTIYSQPDYVDGNSKIFIKFQNDDGSGLDGDCVARSMDWGNSGYGTIHKWKYV